MGHDIPLRLARSILSPNPRTNKPATRPQIRGTPTLSRDTETSIRMRIAYSTPDVALTTRPIGEIDADFLIVPVFEDDDLADDS